MPAAPLRILSTLGVHGVLQGLLPRAAEAGFAPEIRFDPTVRLLAAIRDGAHGDVAILTEEGVADLTASGVLAPSPRRILAQSMVGAAVRAGAPRPDIGTEAAFIATLRAAPSVVYSASGASGLFFAALIERLGIAAEVNAKARIVPQGFTAEPVARGEAALAIQQISELMAVPGVDILGPLPPSCNTTVVFAASCFTGAGAEAGRFVAWLAEAMTREALRAAGLAPA
ncbi:substrate-binding domain-containing protein [Roseomonas sp. AR75]|uniref:molybdate ABC transporter substrate-binding protein n=1 Tax=Roseomonas sp. AR75 TaxID=2562311 RepID=UPI0010C134C3|nr:substrate-binding domain-containing protein [Roseomonas sp. AR75]